MTKYSRGKQIQLKESGQRIKISFRKEKQMSNKPMMIC